MVTAPLGMVAQHFSDLVERAGKLPGGEQLTDTRRQLAAQLGFDPLTREGLLAAGLDPDRAAAAALQIPAEGRGSWVAALPLTRPELFLQTFDRLARERAGYSTRTDEARGDVRIAIYSRAEGRGRLAAAEVKGYGLVARGDYSAADVAAAAERKPEQQALALDARLKAARGKLGAQDVVIFAPQGSPIPQRFVAEPLPGDAAVGLSGSGAGLVGRLSLALPPDSAKRTQEVWPGRRRQPRGAALGDAPVRARLGVAPRQLFAELQKLSIGQRLLERVPEARDLFDALEPGAVVSVALREKANLGAAIDYGIDFRRKSPFDTLQLVALARAKDPAKARAALAAIAKAAPQLAMKVAKGEGDDYTATYEGGEGLRFGLRELDGQPLVYALGGGVGPEQLRRTPEARLPELGRPLRGAGHRALRRLRQARRGAARAPRGRVRQRPAVLRRALAGRSGGRAAATVRVQRRSGRSVRGARRHHDLGWSRHDRDRAPGRPQALSAPRTRAAQPRAARGRSTRRPPR